LPIEAYLPLISRIIGSLLAALFQLAGTAITTAGKGFGLCSRGVLRNRSPSSAQFATTFKQDGFDLVLVQLSTDMASLVSVQDTVIFLALISATLRKLG
jgi:hypothetical protein